MTISIIYAMGDREVSYFCLKKIIENNIIPKFLFRNIANLREFSERASKWRNLEIRTISGSKIVKQF